MDECYARPGQALFSHLENTAEKAAGFATTFKSSEWAYLAGLLHDLGKYQHEFQKRLIGENIRVEHSGIGAVWAYNRWKDSALPLEFSVAGHHTGLANLIKSEPEMPTPLKERLKQNEFALELIKGIIPTSILNANLPELPPFLKLLPTNTTERDSLRRSLEFWTRFLFSALVDADRLDSEAFEQPEKAKLRSSTGKIPELSARFDAYLEQKIDAIPLNLKQSKVNQARQTVLDCCREAADQTNGIFSLIVPTGGGKTLSAMSFAIRHAKANNLKRVIVVIPYTSIIEQNAYEYKQALGEANVIEHHSNFDPEERGKAEDVTRWQLATENWDAPIIVTTSVEFIETLFSSSPSRCRKLHNIARSVIIFDEVQLLPSGFLNSILEAIRELVQNYGCSVVLSTATLPALSARSSLPQGLTNIKQIIPNPDALVRDLRRVIYHWPNQDTPIDWVNLAKELSSYPQMLAVVHKREDARLLALELTNLCPTGTVYHLSALMCPAHRLQVINKIKAQLKAGTMCRVVSTQLVEAGVDVDFPVVYRALGGLDSIVQAAGRCNREGHLERGKVVLFRAPSLPPRGSLRKALQTTDSMLESSYFEPDEPTAIERYFRMLYQKENLDAANIQRERAEFNFATVGRDFHIIEDGFTKNIIVPWGKAAELLHVLTRNGPSRELIRSLQRFTVSIYPDSFQKLLNAGVLIELAPSLHILAPGFEKKYYDEVFGLIVGDEMEAKPALII